MGNYSEEEALFRSYPYAVYFVQSPPASTLSHASATNINYDHDSPSSRGSNNEQIRVLQDADNEEEQDVDDDEYRHRGWFKYISFSYWNSWWWIWVQLSWRLLLSLMIALLVFYVVAKPPSPNLSIKIARIGQFRLGEGVDGSGVTTKILSCNCTINLVIDNNSKLFGLHINPPIMEILFGHLPFAISQKESGEVYARSDDSTLFKLNVGTRNKAMYGAGRNMQDLLESGQGLPLVVRVSLRSSFHVVWGLLQPKFHHQAQCLLLLTDKYDKKHKTQIYNSTCTVINS